MNIIFRVDVSYGVGTGHIYRCLNLARVLNSSKNNIYFLSNSKITEIIIPIDIHSIQLNKSEFTFSFLENITPADLHT